MIERFRLVRKVQHQHLLRALYEEWETQAAEVSDRQIRFNDLLRRRSWSAVHLQRQLKGAQRDGLIEQTNDETWCLTKEGQHEAARVTRNHRLWELFLITHAEIAPSHVDRDADQIEHVLGPEMIAELETQLRRTYPELEMPSSPHQLKTG